MTISRIRFARSLDWNLLKTFHEIVVSNGVTSAAIALSRKQSTVSHALKRLEEELGARLCARGPGGFKLTDEGQILYEHCQTIFSRINGIPDNLDNLSEDIHGQLKIQIISNIVCPRLDAVISRYVTSYPFVELMIEIAPWEGISKAVLRTNCDIGVAPISVSLEELRYDLLFRESHRAYCNAAHPLFGKTITHYTKLSEEKFVLTGNDEPEQLTKFRMKHKLGHHVGGVSSSLEEAKRLAISGAGICFLPEGFTEAEVRYGQLWPVTRNIPALTLDIFVISNPNVPSRIAVSNFLKELEKGDEGV